MRRASWRDPSAPTGDESELEGAAGPSFETATSSNKSLGLVNLNSCWRAREREGKFVHFHARSPARASLPPNRIVANKICGSADWRRRSVRIVFATVRRRVDSMGAKHESGCAREREAERWRIWFALRSKRTGWSAPLRPISFPLDQPASVSLSGCVNSLVVVLLLPFVVSS